MNSTFVDFYNFGIIKILLIIRNLIIGFVMFCFNVGKIDGKGIGDNEGKRPLLSKQN